jgi:hypothetical protein
MAVRVQKKMEGASAPSVPSVDKAGTKVESTINPATGPTADQATEDSSPVVTTSVRQVYYLPHAPAGDCNTAFEVGGETIQVALVDGVYRGGVEGVTVSALLHAGFRVKDEQVSIQDRIVRVSTIYTMQHPDSTDSEPINTDEYHIEANGETVTVALVDGRFETKDVAVMVAASQAGFRVMNTREE